MTSLLIKGARIIDGTGAPAFAADLAVVGDRIARIAPGLPAGAGRTIDATGLAAAPGFIDIHAHGDWSLVQNPTADSKVCDGVTTELLGNCGFSAFPSKECRSAAEFFRLVADFGTSINRAFLVGLGTIREFVLGPDSHQPSPGDLELMRDEVASALGEGVFGVSTGLIYPPGCFATREELAEIARPAGRAGALYSTHMRSEGDQIEEAIAEAEFIARTSGTRLQISHLKLSGERNWNKIDWLDERLHALRKDLDVACDRYPYIASYTDIGVILPNWVHDGSPEQRMERLRDAAVRSRIELEVRAEHPEPEYWDKVVVSLVPEGEDPAYNGKSLRELAALRGEEPIETVMNLLAKHRQKPAAIFFSMCEENLRRVLSWPFVAAGSDARARVLRNETASDKPHPRAYGTFARLLGKYARDEKILSLEDAVRRMTALPAERIGLRGRGVLREGAFADITLFDPAAVADRATFDDPNQTSAGIPYVIVNGRLVIDAGVHSGALAGKVLTRE